MSKSSAEISSLIDSSFDSAFEKWNQQIEHELYPSAFADEHSWLRVKESLKINNQFLKEALKQSLNILLSE